MDDTTALGAVLLAILTLVAVWTLLLIVLGTVALRGGAKIAGIENVTFLKALVASAIGAIASALAGIVVGVIPCFGQVLSPFANLGASLLVIREVFDTTWSKAALAWVLFVIAKIVAGFAAVLLMAGTFATIVAALSGG